MEDKEEIVDNINKVMVDNGSEVIVVDKSSDENQVDKDGGQ